jgi:hypothetical protein
MPKRKAEKVPDYPESHLPDYKTLGIILGDPEFDERIAALKRLCAYYHIKRVELDKQL